jgi:hypothetical protein
MQGLLLDENISSAIADQVSRRRPDIPIQSIFRWRGGALLKQPDDRILLAAGEDDLTLVTYDVSTIMPLVTEWGAAGLTYAGVVFVDEWTIRSNDFGSLVRALERLWDREHEQDWTSRCQFLNRP